MTKFPVNHFQFHLTSCAASFIAGPLWQWTVTADSCISEKYLAVLVKRHQQSVVIHIIGAEFIAVQSLRAMIMFRYLMLKSPNFPTPAQKENRH
jgi:hypothetical protein